MSFWTSLFGKKQKAPSSLPSDSVTSSKSNSTQSRLERLNDQIAIIEKRQAVLNRKIEQEQNLAKEAMVKKNIPKAKLHLKRKKMHQEAVDRLAQQALNLDEMRLKLEEAQCNVAYVKAQQETTQAITEVYGKLTPEKIDDIVEDGREAIEKTNEISTAISQSLGATSLDEEELDEEFESLKQEVEQEELNKKMNTISLPPALSVTTTATKTTVQPGAVAASASSSTTVTTPQATMDEAEAEAALSQLEAELNG